MRRGRPEAMMLAVVSRLARANSLRLILPPLSDDADLQPSRLAQASYPTRERLRAYHPPTAMNNATAAKPPARAA